MNITMIGFGSAFQFIGSIFSAGALGGLVSGELNRRLITRESRKKQLNSLLTDLLEIRHALRGLIEMKALLGPFAAGNVDHLVVLFPQVMEIFLDSGKLQERYEKAAEELGTLDPLLAHKLHSKNLLAPILKVSQLSSQDPAAIPVAARIITTLGDAGIQELDAAISRVAGEIGSGIHRKVEKVLQRKPEMPQQITDLINTMTTIINTTAPKHADVNATAAKADTASPAVGGQ